MRTSWSDPEAFGRHHRRGHAKMRRFTAGSQQRSLGMVRTIRWMTQYDTLSMRDYEIYMKYKPLLNLYWTFRIFSAWLPQSMGSPVLPRDSCDSVLPCFTAWKRSIDWKDRKAVSCKLKAVCDHKQVRNASSPPLAGLVFPGTIELCWSTHVFQCRTSHCKVSTSSFQSFSHTFLVGEAMNRNRDWHHWRSKHCIRHSFCFRHLMEVIYSLSMWKVQTFNAWFLHDIVTEHDNSEKVTAPLKATRWNTHALCAGKHG